MDSAADQVPFKDVVFRSLVPAVAEVFNREHKQSFNQDIFNMALGKAGRYLIQRQQNDSYMPMQNSRNVTDPYG